MIGLSLHSTIFYSYFDTFYCYCVWCVRTSVWFDVMILIFCSNVFFFEFCLYVSFSQSLIFSFFLFFSPSHDSQSNLRSWTLFFEFPLCDCVYLFCVWMIFGFSFSLQLWMNWFYLCRLTHFLKMNQWMNEIFENFDWIIFYTSIWVFEYLYIDDVCFNHLWNHQEWISKNRIIFCFFNP